MWEPLDLHLFVDTAGLATSSSVELVQHAPTKTGEMAVVPDRPWDGGGAQHGAIAGYCSAVQVSPTELRIYYDTFGEYGRFLCVAVSLDAGKTWQKPELGLVEFDGSTANNIIAGRQENSSSVQESIEPGTVFIDDNPATPQSERWKMVMTWRGGAIVARPRADATSVNNPATPIVSCVRLDIVVASDHFAPHQLDLLLG